MLWTSVLLLAAPLAAAVDHLTALGSTQVQIVLSYSAPSAAACTVEASKQANYSPLATDIDPGLFPGSHLDSRQGSISTGRHRVFVLGKQGAAAIEQASNGYTLSRALQAGATYHIRVTCDGESATTTAHTTNIPLGDTRGEPLAISAPFKYKQVTKNKVANPEFADPYTGTLIKNPANVMGFGYSTTTALTIVSGCNIALAGVKGACRYTDASGTGWAATTGTLTDAIQADDNNFAQYSGTSQQKLFIRYGTGRVPTHGTYGAVLASQYVAFSAKTSDANGEGGWARTCFTDDGVTCLSPAKRFTLTASKAVYRVCSDSPCTTPDNPGDTAIDIASGVRPGIARIYNESPAWTTIKFAGANASDACNEFSVGEGFWSFNSATNGDSPVYMTVASQSCGLSPPRITTNESNDLSHNGSTGTTYWRFGSLGSQNYGILVWKESTTSASTIQIDLPLWRATFAMSWRLNAGAGGFGRTCQNVPAAGGYYLCMGGYEGNIIFGIKPTADGLDIRNYGFATWRGDQLSGNLIGSPTAYQSPLSSATNYAMWDDELPGVFYMYYLWKGGIANGKTVLVKLTMNLVEKTVTNPDDPQDPIFGSNRAPKVGLTSAVILTPCTGTCASSADDHTITNQRITYSSDWDAVKTSFPGCSLQAVQGLTVLEVCINGGQDTYSWVFAYDLGNRLPIGGGFVGTRGGNTAQIFGGFPSHDTPSCRWCALHTYQSPAHPGGSPFANLEMTNKCQLQVTGSALSSCSSHPTSGTCSACPAGTVIDGYDYSGKPMCSNLTFSSNWNGAWGTQPAAFESGDPVDAVCDEAPNLYWLQKLKVGDFLNHTQSGAGIEYVRLAKRTDNQNWVVIRGWGGIRDSSTYGAKNHSNGGTWFTKCGSIIKDPITSAPLHGYALAWYFGNDATGQNEDYAFLNPFQNHGVNGLGYGVAVEGGYNIAKFDFTDPAANKAARGNEGYYPIGSDFAGKSSFCQGNSCEKHPSASQVAGDAVAQSSYADIHPRLFTGNNSTSDAPLVAGKTYIRVYSGDRALDFKHYDIESFMGTFGLQRVDTLSDSAGDTGRFCIAIAANDCFSGSMANKLYFVNEAMDPNYTNGSRISCRNTQFSVWMGDTCTANTSPASATVAQYRFPPAGVKFLPNGAYSRVVSKEWRSYREAATENAKADPTGNALLMRGHWYIVPPPMVGKDSINRGTFAAIPVTLSSVPVGTSTAWIEFGYNADFQCSRNRDDVCIAQSSALNESLPFLFSQETPAGVPCASGCVITIPSIHNRVLYWRVRYRNGSGDTIATGVTQAQAVN